MVASLHRFRIVTTCLILALVLPLCAKKMVAVDSMFMIVAGQNIAVSFTTYDYDGDLNRIKSTTESGGTKAETFFEYRGKKLVMQRTVSNGQETFKQTMTYAGDLLVRDSSFALGALSSFSTHTFSAQNKPERDSTCNASGKLQGFVIHQFAGTTQTSTSYDSTSAKAGKTVTEYNGTNLPLKVTSYDKNDVLLMTTTTTYRPDNQILESKLTMADGSMESVTTNEYDADNCNTVTRQKSTLKTGTTSEMITNHYYRDVPTSLITRIPSRYEVGIAVHGTSLTLQSDAAAPILAATLCTAAGRVIANATGNGLQSGHNRLMLTLPTCFAPGCYMLNCTTRDGAITRVLRLP